MQLDSQRTHSVLTLVGSVFLGLSSLFVAINVLQYELGVGIPWNPFDALYTAAQSETARYALDGLIVLGPVLALAAYLLPLVSIRVDLKSDHLATIVVHKANRATLFLLGACVLVFALFGLYFLVENWPV